MRKISRTWLSVVIILSLLSVIFLMPNITGGNLPSWWSKVFPSRGIRLGLDLKGGIFLQLGVQVEKALEQELSTMREVISEELKADKGLIKSAKKENETLTINFFSPNDLNKARQIAEDNFSNVANISETDLSLILTLNSNYISEVRKNAVTQVQQVIQNRVQDFGLVEPTIQKAGDRRILIQVPGASQEDRERIVDLIKKSAVLEFKIVKDAAADKETLLAKYNASSEEDLVAQGLMMHTGETGNQNEAYFVTNEEPGVTGEFISDARITFDNFGRPSVGFRFRGEGATKFGNLTENNIGERLAIVLDGKIQSAPVINDKITYEGTITGDFTSEEAKDLALVLRSGSLPVPVVVQQERSVGPSLGHESIEKGKLSMTVGGILVIIFMVLFYRFQGFVADIALILNMLFIMGFLAAFGVTLTLPGIAGLVLTLGMAVDGNIIIFERIKEELRVKKQPIAAIDAGYGRSLWTVLDANITTLITAVILFWFGTGPIKGFAATLTIGIISTVFSNVIVARMITNIFYRGKEIKEVSI